MTPNEVRELSSFRKLTHQPGENMMLTHVHTADGYEIWGRPLSRRENKEVARRINELHGFRAPLLTRLLDAFKRQVLWIR